MEKIVSIGDKSKEMGVSRQTIYNMLEARRLEADYIDNQGRHFWKALGKEKEKMSCIDEVTQSQMQQLEHLSKVLKTISEELCRKRSKSLEVEEEEEEENDKVK